MSELERIARLEQRADHQSALLEEMHADIKQLRSDWTRARGLVAGIVLTVSAIWGAVLAAWQFLRHKLGA